MKKCFKGVAKGMAAALTLAVVIAAVSFSPVITYAATTSNGTVKTGNATVKTGNTTVKTDNGTVTTDGATVTIKSDIPTEQSKKSMQFIEKLNVYSDFIKTNGQYFSRSNTQICKTFRQAKTTIKKKKTTGANCVMPVNWALKEMELLATNANFYSKTNGNFSGVSANMKKNLVTFKKGDVVTEAGDLIGMKVVDAAKAGLLVRGDIIANQSFTHTYVFDSFSNGKIYVYEAGGNANGLGYSKVGCGPFYAKQYNGLRIAGLMRWK